MEGFVHCVSSYRVVGGSFASVSESVDQKVAQRCLRVGGMTEGNGDSDGVAEGDPASKVRAFLLSVSAGVGLSGDVESSMEVSVESTSGLR